MTSTSILLIDKNGEIKSAMVKDTELVSLSKKAGFKSAEGFVLQHTWGQDDGLDQNISLYAKTDGRAGQENKYDFPPPMDERLFFGTCVLVGRNTDGKPVALKEEDWEEIYEFLFGGFEDIGSSDSEDDDDIATDDELEALAKGGEGAVVKQTKQGYAKDGFIVDDNEEDEDYEESSEESSVSEDTPPRKGRKSAANKVTTSKKGQPTATKRQLASTRTGKVAESLVVAQQPQQTEMSVEDCESELSEESYD